MKNSEKLICIFSESKKENKYTDYKVVENIDTILEFRGKSQNEKSSATLILQLILFLNEWIIHF
ncbi:hypothetical protein MCANUFG4_01636 [Mycoplasmopsis canis UFG4]|uniref:Uncharacterized protein n=1 Tax=Mycoplasmopsis canis UFG4 TaxID=1131455 RepID=I1A5H8_9BACT|nr:hypothetical protein [Mycoplasmopsis canis]EIE41749.1 hypothetical protein MCANUFG4_01636 [Mycoplasmopsis canis UFG4]